MNEPVQACPQCNAPMPEGSTSSLCAKCLLQVGFETDPGPASDSESRAYQPTFIAPTIDELAPHFPQLEILEQIGHGGMGVVYKARQTELDRIVALKILRPNISNDASFAERFQREARALAKLNHPNIVTIYDFGRKDGLFFFIMEYVDGTNLRHVERSGQLSPQEALCIVPQVCSALQYAHDNGVVHRDIKPENILITKSGDVRIADFGLAKLAGVADDAPLTGTWQVMGTPHYMAPEQFEKPATVDHRADIYSLGVVIYELLTGELPIGRFRLPSEKVRVDVRLDEVVLRSLDKEPDRRYQRITDVATAVSSASSSASSEKHSCGSSLQDLLKQWWSNGKKNARALDVYRHGLGTALMFVSVIDVLISLLYLADQPSNDTLEFMSGTGMFAGSVAFWFGRQYRRNLVSTFLVCSAIVSIPWLSPLIVFSFARMALTIVILCTLFAVPGDKPSDPTLNGEREPPPPDLIDKAFSALRNVRSVVTRRILLLTIFGIVGWCLAWGLSTAGLGILWYFSYTINHVSARGDLSIVDIVALGAAAIVWLIGLIRVLRVLYRNLWKTAAQLGDPESLLLARSQWKCCCRSLVLSAVISGLLSVIVVSSISMFTLPTNISNKYPASLTSPGLMILTFVFLSSSIVIGAFLASPVFRWTGRLIGLIAGGMAIVIIPPSLLTFPNGLAVWILLTDPAVRQLFRGDAKNNSGAEIP